VRITAARLRDFRGYELAEAPVGPGLTVVSGPNGAGKTNLLEAIYFGCTGRSCRTTNERELVRFGAPAARVVIQGEAEDGIHELSVGFAPGEPKRMRVDGADVERLLDLELRPLMSVFLPDRLELIKGPPALRRAHVDQLVGALWPARSTTRRRYAQSLAQRNALIARVRAGTGSRSSITAWDHQLAVHGIELMRNRDAAVSCVREWFSPIAAQLGLAGDAELVYRPRSAAQDAEGLAYEIAQRTETDLDRGFSGHGPHRDDLATLAEGCDLRTYGSQGQQRLALLALLLAEREAITASRRSTPMLLLDDVMSELDRARREALVELLRHSGQSLITTTDLEHVPCADGDDIVRLEVGSGHRLHQAVPA
jgi:DNA replication and repair protein RecF